MEDHNRSVLRRYQLSFCIHRSKRHLEQYTLCRYHCMTRFQCRLLWKQETSIMNRCVWEFKLTCKWPLGMLQEDHILWYVCVFHRIRSPCRTPTSLPILSNLLQVDSCRLLSQHGLRCKNFLFFWFNNRSLLRAATHICSWNADTSTSSVRSSWAILKHYNHF